jgi:O-antigen/teichoic acid export membrane protein
MSWYDSAVSTPGAIPQPDSVTGAVQPGAAIARNAFYLVLGQVATTALAILLNAVLGRSLGAADFGLYFLVVSMTTFANVFADWGQNLLLVREVARLPGRASSLLGTSIAIRVVGAAVVSLPAYAASRALGYDARTCLYSVIFIWATLPLFVAQAYGMVFRGRDRMGLDATISVSNKALLLGFTVALLAIGTGIPGVIAAQAVAGLGALAVAAWLYRRLRAGPLRASRETTRAMLYAGTAIVTMTAAVGVQPYLDVVILSRLAPAASVGWYGAAKNIIGTLFAPATILASASFPRLSRSAHDAAALRPEFRAALRPLLWLGALAGVGTYLFADLAVAIIYGTKGFGPAGVILRVFSLGLFLLFIDVLLGHVITAAGRTTGFAIAKVASVIVSTALDLWLIPVFQQRLGNGGIGVIVAFAASEFVVFGGALYLMPRGSLEPRIAVDVGRAIASAAATALLFWLLPPLSPVLGIPLCIGTFALASFALGLVSREDLLLMARLLPSGASRVKQT